MRFKLLSTDAGRAHGAQLRGVGGPPAPVWQHHHQPAVAASGPGLPAPQSAGRPQSGGGQGLEADQQLRGARVLHRAQSPGELWGCHRESPCVSHAQRRCGAVIVKGLV